MTRSWSARHWFNTGIRSHAQQADGTRPMYYMLECYGPRDRERQAVDQVSAGYPWSKGRPLAEPVTEPIEVLMDGDGVMVPMFNRGILLMRDDLVEAIRSAGVENIDCYRAEVVDPVADVRYGNYQAVNIIGMVAAADLEQSDYSTPSGVPVVDTNFESVVIDEAKAKGILLFRMAECVTAIVIHESVKASIERAGILDLNFVTPESWFG